MELGEPRSEPTPPPPVVTIAQPRGRLSRLAVAAFSFSIVGCCANPAAIAAVILGFVSLERIKRSGGAMRGRNFAITGIVLGCVGLVTSLALQNFAFSTIERYETQMRDGVVSILSPTVDSTVAVDSAIFAAEIKGVSTADRAAFRSAVVARYGVFESFTVISTEPIGSMLEPSFNWEVMFRFADGKTITGVVRTKLVPEIGSIMPVSRMTKIRLDGGDAESLQLPAIEKKLPEPSQEDSGSEDSKESTSKG